MKTGITLLNLYNKALALVGDYTLTTDSELQKTGLYLMTQSLCNEAVDYVFSELRGLSNLRVLDLSTATLVGDFYELDLGSEFLYKSAYKLYRGGRGFNFTSSEVPEGIKIEFRNAPTQPGKSVLLVHKSYIDAPLGEYRFEYFYSPNSFGNSSSNLTMHPLAIEAVAYRMAQALAIQLNEDVTLGQLYGKLSLETMDRLKRATSLTHGRPYFATIRG